MILTDRIAIKHPTSNEDALKAVHDFYATDPGEPESCGTVVQHWCAWCTSETHFFVVMVDGRCDCLRVWRATGGKWVLSVDSQTEFPAVLTMPNAD